MIYQTSKQSLILLFADFAVLLLSFWAEVHYNSIYPQGGNCMIFVLFGFKSKRGASLECYKNYLSIFGRTALKEDNAI